MGSSSNTYNGDGTLVQQHTTSYTQDLAAPLSQILSDGTNRFVYGTPAERLFGEAAGIKTWYLTDALGSLRATLDDAGVPIAAANYDAWGVPETPLIAPFGFTGELQQGSDVWLRARWYGAGRGGFGSRDPYAGDAQTPYSLMYYQYGYSNPVRWVDPSGQAVRDPLREPGVCPPGMFAACYDEFAQQHSSNRHLHPSENANFAFLDAYKDEAFAYQGTDLGFDYTLWRLQYKDTAEGRIALVHGAAEECGPAGGIAGIAEGANELNKSLARGGLPRIGLHSDLSEDTTSSGINAKQLADEFTGTQSSLPTQLSNAEIRAWYNKLTSHIPTLNKSWILRGIPLETRARAASDIRHWARIQARSMMMDANEVAELRARDLKKYNNPDGPTFEWLVNDWKKRGLQGNDIYEAIINGANRTDPATNERFSGGDE